MANMCSLTIELEFKNTAIAEEFSKSFKAKEKEAYEQCKGLYIGSERYLFDADIDHDGESIVSIHAWVRWFIDAEEAAKFIQYVKSKYELVKAEIQYEELGCCIYGKYVYKDNTFTNYYVDADHDAFTIDDDNDSQYDALDDALENDAKVEVYSNFSQQETNKQ